MSIITNNIWKDDKGFIWMLAISLLALASSQNTAGFLLESKLLVRVCFFLVTLIAIKASSVSNVSKVVGYSIASAILLLALALTQTESSWLVVPYTVLLTGYMVYIIALVVNMIFAEGKITTYKIAGGVAAYVLLGHVWASLYLTIYYLYPESFQFGGDVIQSDEAMKHLSYFSFVTLTTIGYGDVTAVGAVARTLAMMEGLLGQLFPAIFIAKLVSMQIGDSK